MSGFIIEQYKVPANEQGKLERALEDYEWETGYDVIVTNQGGSLFVTRYDILEKFNTQNNPHNPEHLKRIQRIWPRFRPDSLARILRRHGVPFTHIVP